MGKHAFCIASFQRLAKSLLTTAFPEQAVIKSDFVCTLYASLEVTYLNVTTGTGKTVCYNKVSLYQSSFPRISLFMG